MEKYLLKSQKSRFNRMCIAEAIIELMKTEELKKIKISTVVKKAGVSRTTFYKHFNSLEEVLDDYMNEIVAEYNIERAKNAEIKSLYDYKNILLTIYFFDQYADFFKTVTKQGFYSLLIDAINSFMTKNIYFDKNDLYELYCYSGGLLNIFIKWEENGKKEKPEEIAQIVYDLFHHFSDK